MRILEYSVSSPTRQQREDRTLPDVTIVVDPRKRCTLCDELDYLIDGLCSECEAALTAENDLRAYEFECDLEEEDPEE
jgi:hypothetical protein